LKTFLGKNALATGQPYQLA